MMVSIATAVLPVWRSPMISSRWPRPTGTMESIAFRPVCTGCATDLRAITPGATFSMTSLALAAIGPLPSIGALHRVALGDVLVLAQDHGADREIGRASCREGGAGTVDERQV